MCLAIPGRILDLPPEEPHFALVDVSGVRRKINIDLVSEQELKLGDWVLIHVGFAMSKISEEEARDQTRLLEMLGEAEAALEEARGYGLGEAEPPQGRSKKKGEEGP